MYSIDIFCKSYKGDFKLLQIALETIKRNITGYTNLILLIPEKDKHEFDTRNLPDKTFVFYVDDDDNKGWLRQQVFKMQAPNYCFSQYILFTDSDAFWHKPINVQDLIIDGKPEILYTSWDKVGQAVCWKQPTSNFLKKEAEYETMRRLQQIYHRSTIVSVTEFEPKFEEIIMNSVLFSEFNVMSSYAFQHEKDKYIFTNTDNWEYKEPVALQVWSKASKEEGASELHHLEYIRLLESIMKSFGVPIP